MMANPSSRSYSYCFVDGLTVIVVIDEHPDRRVVRIDTVADARPLEVFLDGSLIRGGARRMNGVCTIGGPVGEIHGPAGEVVGHYVTTHLSDELIEEPPAPPPPRKRWWKRSN